MIWPCGMASSFKATGGQHPTGLSRSRISKACFSECLNKSVSLLALSEVVAMVVFTVCEAARGCTAIAPHVCSYNFQQIH